MSGWKGLLSVIDGGGQPTKTIDVTPSRAIERLPDMQDLADDVERTTHDKNRAIAAHEAALEAWRKGKAERGLE